MKCLYCGQKFEKHPRCHSVQKYCSASCRYKYYAEHNRQKLNETVRKYRARRYLKDGKWRDE